MDNDPEMAAPLNDEPGDGLEGQFRLLAEAFDFPPPSGVKRRYLIASTPRSGSTMLAMQLWRTGGLGAPLEYFNFANVMPRLQLRFRSTTLDAYVRQLLRARTSPNGVFGLKAHWTQMQFMLIAGLWTALRPERIVRIRRRDRLAQAVSLTIATQTGKFSSLDGAGGEAVYDAARIRASADYIERSEAAWDEFLTTCDVAARVYDYEDLAVMDSAGFASLTDFLADDASSGPSIDLPVIHAQSDGRNRAWIERFRQEEGAL